MGSQPVRSVEDEDTISLAALRGEVLIVEASRREGLSPVSISKRSDQSLPGDRSEPIRAHQIDIPTAVVPDGGAMTRRAVCRTGEGRRLRIDGGGPRSRSRARARRCRAGRRAEGGGRRVRAGGGRSGRRCC